MFSGQVSARVVRLWSESGLRPRLFISVVLKNKGAQFFDLLSIGGRAHVVAATASTHHSTVPKTYVGQVYSPHAQFPCLTAGSESSVTFAIDLDFRLIDDIQRLRKASDLWLFLELQAVAALREGNSPVIQRIGGQSVPGEEAGSDPYVAHKIARSDWMTILEGLGFGKYFLLEVPLPRIRASKKQEGTLACLQRAFEHHAEGRHREVLAACFDSLEAHAKVLGHKNPDLNAYTALLVKVGDAEKATRVAQLIHRLVQVLHLGRHSAGNKMEITSADADLALTLTHSVIAYLLSVRPGEATATGRPKADREVRNAEADSMDD